MEDLPVVEAVGVSGSSQLLHRAPSPCIQCTFESLLPLPNFCSNPLRGTPWLLHQLHLSALCPLWMRLTLAGFNLKRIIYKHAGLKIHFWAQELLPGPVRLSGKLGLGQDVNLPDFVSGSSDLSRLILGKNAIN